MTRKFDVIVVGAGILGLAHAFHAAKRNLRVLVIERGDVCRGASVRNFGMVATIAQTSGPCLERSMRTRDLWLEIARESGIRIDNCGCLFVATTDEELNVLTSFAELEHSKERGITLVNSSNLAEYSPPIKLQNLAGGMWVPEVIKIDQRHAIKMFAQWLYETKNIEFQFATQVDAIDAPFVETTTETLEANSIIVCGGDELETLFPDALESEGVIRCQLQMLRTHPQPEGWRLGPFILGGLSIGRYAGFQECDGIAELKRQLEDRYPVHIENGINAIAVQELDGSVTIGDSHKYGKHFSPDRSEEADRLILDYLSERIDLANPGIADRWLGHYAFHPHADIIDIEPQPNVRLVTMTNGQGMTHGLAIAEKNIRNLL